MVPINQILILCLSIFLTEEPADSNYTHNCFSLIFLFFRQGRSLASRHKDERAHSSELFLVGGGRREEGKAADGSEARRGACAEGHELQSSRTSQKMGDLSASAAFSIVWVFP